MVLALPKGKTKKSFPTHALVLALEPDVGNESVRYGGLSRKRDNSKRETKYAEKKKITGQGREREREGGGMRKSQELKHFLYGLCAVCSGVDGDCDDGDYYYGMEHAVQSITSSVLFDACRE